MTGRLLCSYLEFCNYCLEARSNLRCFSCSVAMALSCILAGCAISPAHDEQSCVVSYAPQEIHRGTLPGYDSFYSKHLKAGPMHIASSDKVPDAALHEAVFLILCVLDGREDIQQAIRDAEVHLALMSHDEFTTDVPEHADLEPAEWWDRRARGLGATVERPAWSAGAENLLDYPGDPYRGENILIHEFAHVIHHFGLRKLDPTFEERLTAAYEEAKKAGKWEGTYAITNIHEYWAEGVQVYFECNPAFTNKLHGEIDLREELKVYDLTLFDLLDEAFKGNPYKYSLAKERSKQPHLREWDFDKAPTFAWPEGIEE